MNYSKENINKWYELVKNKRRIRVVNIHNNLSLEHYIKGNKPYLISWEKSKIDNPIYDLYNLYLNHYLDFDFSELFLNYESKYPLLKEERILLFSLMILSIIYVRILGSYLIIYIKQRNWLLSIIIKNQIWNRTKPTLKPCIR